MKRITLLSRAALTLLIMTMTTTTAWADTVVVKSSSREVTLCDGDVVKGTGGEKTHIKIASGATITLCGVDISGERDDFYPGIMCQGNATIILAKGKTNAIRGTGSCSGIYWPEGCTLTIRGSGTLNVGSEGNGAGIGSYVDKNCGHLVIEGGTITANAFSPKHDQHFLFTSIGEAAGIGAGRYSKCGNITITGGNISASSCMASGIGSCGNGECGNITITGGTVNADADCSYSAAAAIGSDTNGKCGNITIVAGQTCVIAQSRSGVPYSIGPGSTEGESTSTCGTVTIGGVQGYITDNSYTYAPTDIPYTVTFNANGGSGTATTQSFSSNTPQALSANTFTRSGYTFLHWNTAADDSGYDFADEATVNNLGNVTLYAQWHLNDYSVRFDRNGGVGTMTDLTLQWNTPQALPVNTYERAGYEFVGWNSESDGSGTAYTDGQTVTNVEASTLYAQWQPIVYHISYVLDGGVNADSNPDTYTIESNNILLSKPTRIFSTFIGWTCVGVDEPTMSIVIGQGSMGDVTFTAHWQPITLCQLTSDVGSYTLLDGQRLTGTGGPDTHITIADGATITLADVVINDIRIGGGHNWAGITCAGDATIILEGTNVIQSGDRAQPGIFIPAGKTLTIYGNGSLTVRSYSSDQYLYGAPGIGGSVHEYAGNIVIEGGNITAIGGYGTPGIGAARWPCGYITITRDVISVTATAGDNCPNAIGASSYYSSGTVTIGGIETGSIGVSSYTYVPSVAHCSVSFNANGGEDTMADQHYLKDAPFALQACTFSKNGYTSVGWNTAADGSGTAYTDGQTITISDNLTLYAQWKKNLTVTFNANEGSGTMADQAFVKDIPQSLTANVFFRENYAFAGWNTAADGSGTAYSDGQSIAIGSDMTLYAQWIPTYTVSFDANGGTGNMTDQTFVEDIPQSLTANLFSRENYVFAGWNTAADGSGTAYSDGQSIAIGSDMTLYAQWIPTYTVSFDANGGTGNMADQTFVESVAQSLSPCSLFRDYFDFIGWNTAADGSGIAYDDGETIAVTGDLRLFAQWSEHPIFLITFDANGGGGSMENQAFHVGEVQCLNVCSLTPPDGSFFIGWNTQADGSGIDYTDGQNITIRGNLILYAQWYSGSLVDLSRTLGGKTLQDGSVVTGVGKSTTRLTIAAGATVMLNGVTLSSKTYSPITCEGDATIILKGDNVLEKTGIPQAVIVAGPAGTTLTIKGTGSLTATVSTTTPGNTAAIGSSSSDSCGDIVIEGGTITATAWGNAAAIGCAKSGSCGTVSIRGGVTSVTAITTNTNTTNFGTKAPHFGKYDGSGIVSICCTLTDETSDDGLTRTLTGPAFELLDNAANASSIARFDGMTTPAVLTGRTLYKDGNWNTICLPFDVTLADSPLGGDNVEARTLIEASLNGSTLTLTFSPPQENLVSGVPYIIKWNNTGNNIVSPVFSNVKVNSYIPMEMSQTGIVSFKGTFDAINLDNTDKSILFLGADNTLYYPLAGASIGACRAYFQLGNGLTVGEGSNAIQGFRLNFGDGDATGFDDQIVNSKSSDSKWYDLSGRQLDGIPTAKGIYIKDGKKIVIK